MNYMKAALKNKKMSLALPENPEGDDESKMRMKMDLAPLVEDSNEEDVMESPEEEIDEENEALSELLEYGAKELEEPAEEEAQEKQTQPMHEDIESALLPKILAHHEGNDEKPRNTLDRRAIELMRSKLKKA